RTPGAWRWNLCGFVLPGLLLFVFALALEVALQRDGKGRVLRIGTGLLMLSALAFAAQGLLPFDLEDPHALASQRHVSALVLALLGLLAGAVFVDAGLMRRRWRAPALLGLALAFALLMLLLWPRLLPLGAGHAQRVLLGLY